MTCGEQHDVEAQANALLDTLLSDSSTSVYSTLAAVLSQDPALPPICSISSPDQITGSFALTPAPKLNGALSKLVALLVAPRSPKLTAKVVEGLERNASKWKIRAIAVKSIAAAAERELELRAAEQICGYYNIDVDACCQPGEHRIDSSIRLVCNGKEIEKSCDIATVFRFFPYVSNYELLVDAEAQILGGDLPRSLISRHDSRLLPSVKEQSQWWDSRSHHRIRSSDWESDSYAVMGMVVAFCGSGPMPLTAILLHVRAGASVVLVDIDSEAVQISKRLISILEHLHIVREGALHVVHSDATAVQFRAADREACIHATNAVSWAGNVPQIQCHAVLLASLLDQQVKSAVAAAVAAAPDGPQLLLARSAHGLVAKLAYHCVNSDQLAEHLDYCGVWVPRRNPSDIHVKEDADHHKEHPESGILGWIDSRVLNSIEVYQRPF